MITDAQGIDCIEEIKILTDGDIDNIWKVVRRPGGINPITNVANLGIQVSLRAENNLKLSRFFLKHKARTGRVAVATYITLDSVRLLRELKESDKEQKMILWYLRWLMQRIGQKPWRVWRSTLGGILELKGYHFLMWWDSKERWPLAWMNLRRASCQPNTRWLRAHKFLKVVWGL